VLDIILRMQRSGRPVLVNTRSVTDSESLGKRLTMMAVDYTILNAVHHEQEAEVVAKAGKKGQVTIATNMAGRGTDIILDSGVAKLGGLHVIATERHESRRVDHQLFGRSARQGQAGSSQAVLSLADYLITHWVNDRVVLWLKPWTKNYLGNAVVHLLYVLMQKNSERVSSKMRNQMLQDDYKLNEMLSFAGK